MISDEPHGGDHIPITIQLFPALSRPSAVKAVRYKLDSANWYAYQKAIEQHFANLGLDCNVNKSAAILQRKIRQSANSSIPISRTTSPYRKTYWWNDKLSFLRGEKLEMWKNVKRNPTKENIMLYKRTNALFKREAKLSKRNAFIEFTKDINYKTP